MKNHFTIIIPAYNCEEWVEWNLTSVLRQDYDPLLFNIVYVDDHSSDNTFGLVNDIYEKFENNFSIVSNKENKKALYNLHTHIHQAKEGSIIVTLDGDDALAGTDVLQKLDKLYQDPDCWMSVGSYMQNGIVL